MADRYEPKLSVRPLSERKPAASSSAESDPLVELTRIVTGRTTFDPAPAPKAKTVPVNPAVPANGGASLTDDLESELLNDLQATFALLRGDSPAPAPAAPAPVATAPMVSPPVPPPVPPAPRPAPPVMAPAPRPNSVPPPMAPRVERAAAQARPNPPVPPPASMAERFAPILDRPGQAPVPPTQTLGERQSIYRSGNGPTVDLSHLQMRPTAPATPPAADPSVRAPSRWPPQGTDARVAPPVEAPSRFAPPRAVAPPPGTDSDLLDQPLPDDAQLDEEFQLDDLSALPEYGDDELPPFPEDELAGLSRRRTSRAVVLIAGVLVVALAGGLGYAMLSDGSSASAPPIITADASPTKVIPEPSAVPADPAKDTDRVDSSDSTTDTTLVTPNEPVAPLPDSGADSSPISRVLLPAGPGFDEPAPDDVDPGSSSEPAQIGPKKVRTVVVRPDGTIVSSEAVDPNAPVSASDPNPANPAATSDIPPPEDVADATPPPVDDAGMGKVLDGGNGSLAVDTDPLATASKPTAPAPEPAPAPAIATEEPGTVPADDPPLAVTPPVPVAKPVQKPVKPTVVASAKAAPIDLTPAADTPVKIPAGGALVQLSSQKSEDAARAAYQGLQRKFPSILGNYRANIARADLGDRGIYYRVRVGPFAGADATRLCEDLRAAGGDCIIAR